MIKCCFVNTNEKSGGAAVATWRLFESMHQLLPQSRYLVSRKTSSSGQVISANDCFAYLKPRLRSHQERVFTRLQGGRCESLFSTARFRSHTAINKINSMNPDIVHLHWINNGFLAIEDLQHIDAPLVWTLHDMWAFTGGCHYPAGCTHWLKACGNCPQLARSSNQDLSFSVFSRKLINWPKLDLTIVTPSHWLADLAGKSPLLGQFPVHVIPNGLDTHLYSQQKKSTVRRLLKLPQKKPLALFGAVDATDDKRKGFDLLTDGLGHLPSTLKKRLELVVFGNRDNKLQEHLDCRVHFIGEIEDELKLSTIYAAADLFIAPSREDNLPNTCIEAMACGTPVVAFNIGGMPDIITHKQSGYLANAFDTKQLATGITWVVDDLEDSDQLRLAARSQAEKKYSQATNAGYYLALYRKILKTRS